MAGSNGSVEEVRIGVPWGVIAVKCWNSRGSSPVLVTHGLGENAGAFDRLMPLLSRDFYYVVVDLPGHGCSSALPEGLPLDFMNYVSQLQRIVSHFRWEKLSLMGHSFGAHLLEFFAATFTRKIERLILLDAIAPTPVAAEIFLLFHRNQTKELIGLEEARKSPTVYTYEEAFAKIIDRRMSKLEPEAAKPLLQRCLKKTGGGYVFTTDPRIRREIRPALGEEVIFEQFHKISCPVLAILAKNSEQYSLFNSHGFYKMALRILENTDPMSLVVRVPGNHCVHNNQPEIIAPIINRFLVQQKMPCSVWNDITRSVSTPSFIWNRFQPPPGTLPRVTYLGSEIAQRYSWDSTTVEPRSLLGKADGMILGTHLADLLAENHATVCLALLGGRGAPNGKQERKEQVEAGLLTVRHFLCFRGYGSGDGKESCPIPPQLSGPLGNDGLFPSSSQDVPGTKAKNWMESDRHQRRAIQGFYWDRVPHYRVLPPLG